MFTHNQTNGDMPLNDLVEYGYLQPWTNLNTLNCHPILPFPEGNIRTNRCVKRQHKTNYIKGGVAQSNNCYASMRNPYSPMVMKYPRTFRPVVLQHHPEYSRRMLPQSYDLRHTSSFDREPLTLNNGEETDNSYFHNSSGSVEEMDEKFYKRIFRFQFSFSGSVKENSNHFSRPQSDVPGQYLTMDNPEGNLQPINIAMKPTELDVPYVPENNWQSVYRQDIREPSQNHLYNMRLPGSENDLFREQMCRDTHKEMIPHSLPPTKHNITHPDRTDQMQPYYAGLTYWKDSFSLNRLNQIDDIAYNEALPKISSVWKPIFSLENSENSIGNTHNIFDSNSKQFTVLNDSRPHYTHPQERLNVCPYCNRSNSSPAQLRIHLRIHTGERPYVCDNVGCDKAFTRNEELTRHSKIHSGDRPYNCKICKRSFGRKDHLTKHEVTHRSASDKKVHICLVAGCKQRYTRSDALARHRWNVHFIRPQVRTIGAKKNQTRKKQQD